MQKEQKWLDWAVELQSLAQSALYYCKDKFDIERFERIREISAEMLSEASGLPTEKVKEIFCNEVGFQTPKLDCRAAIFKGDKILLVQENNKTWSLPGGWVDVDQSVKQNTIKEVKEVQDREKHNLPIYAYKVCKIFVQCSVIGGAFQENIETIQSRYFSLDELPPLAEEKNTKEQIEMCFQAYRSKDWETMFD